MNLKEQRAAALKAAQDILNGAQAAGRDLTAHEQTMVEAKFAEIEGVDEKIARAEKSGDIMRRIEALPGRPSEDFDDLLEEKAALTQAIMRKQPYQARIPRKAMSTGGMNLTPTDNGAVGSIVGSAARSLRELFPTKAVETPTVRYYRVGPVSGGPDIVVEGELKPELVSEIAPRDESMVKLAGHFSITSEFLDDGPAIAQEVLHQALLQLVARENRLVLDRMNASSGILVASGAKTSALETIAAEIGVQESVNGRSPELIVVNPADLAAMRMAKASGSGEFLIGDPLSATNTGIFGIPVLSTPSAAPGVVWLVRKEAGVFYERQACTITSAPAGDDLIHNRVTIVIEERVLPVIVLPSLLTRITLT